MAHEDSHSRVRYSGRLSHCPPSVSGGHTPLRDAVVQLSLSLAHEPPSLPLVFTLLSFSLPPYSPSYCPSPCLMGLLSFLTPHDHLTFVSYPSQTSHCPPPHLIYVAISLSSLTPHDHLTPHPSQPPPSLLTTISPPRSLELRSS